MPHGNESDFHDPADSNAASYEAHPIDEIDPIVAEKEKEDLAALGRVLAPILVWCAEAKTLVGLGQRLWVLIYIIRPDLIAGETLDSFGSLNNCTRQAMDKIVTQFRDNFCVTGRNMRSNETRERCRQSHLR